MRSTKSMPLPPVTGTGDFSSPPASVAAALLLLLLAFARTAAAHGGQDEPAGPVNMTSGHGRLNASAPADAPSYSQRGDHTAVMGAHVVLMTIAWIFLLPICVVLSIAESRRSAPLQLALLLVNLIGLICGMAYNAATPDLYAGNAHHSLGWVVTWMATAQGVMALINTYAGRWEAGRKRRADEAVAFIPSDARAEHGDADFRDRFSLDSGQGTERNTDSLPSHASTTSLRHGPDDVSRAHQPFAAADEAEKRAAHRPSRRHEYDPQHPSIFSPFHILGRFLDMAYVVVERVILILAFAAYLTGPITFAGIFKGDELFSGLAHFIKGGIFFWYGILTLGRWSGSFADAGWAWNIQPPRAVVGARTAPSAEFVESFLFFVYGCSNVFLEHLAAWGEAWTAIDLEHIAITLMFAGGGLLGMLIESPRIRSLLDPAQPDAAPGPARPYPYAPLDGATPRPPAPPPPPIPTNPVPAMVVLLLGLIMSAHHQDTAVSTTLHRQWGTLLVCAALARALTYLLLHLKPASSARPTRPPSEVATAFCLMAAGALFMGSARGVVALLVRYHLDAMFCFTVVAGLVLMAMAWVLVLLALKGWAVRTEGRAARHLFAPGSS